MRRLPVLPTLVVAAAVGIMVYLGIWQLQRARWKAELIAELSAAPALPPVNLDAMPLSEAGRYPFRRATATCAISGAAPEVRAGRNRAGASGFRYMVPCRPGADGAPPALLVDIGWSRDPAALDSVDAEARFAGLLSSGQEDIGMVLIADAALPPLAPSAPPNPEEIPDNHLLYAGQWFLFAGIALIIYAISLWGRRRRRGRPA